VNRRIEMAKVTYRIATEDDPIYSGGFVISSHEHVPERARPKRAPKKTDGVPKLTVPEDLQNMDVDPADGFRITANKNSLKE
jgi:hypothetical protein